MSQYRKPVSIKPAGVARARSGISGMIPAGIGYSYLLLRTLLLSCLLAGMAIAIGLYSYRIYSVHPASMVDAMDAVFKQAPPAFRVIQITAIPALLFAFLFYGEYVLSQLSHRQERVNGLVRFLAGLVLVVWVDIYLFKLDFYRLYSTGVFPKALPEILSGQIVSVVCILLFFPIFKKLLRLGSLSLPSFAWSDRTRTILNASRYYILSALLLLWVTYLATIGYRERNFFDFQSIDFPVVRSGVFLAALSFTLLFLRPPVSLGINRSFSLVRLLLVVLSIVCVGFFYSLAPNPELFLTYASVALILTWLSQPIAHLFY